jgi:hypothetical protein
LSRVDNVWAVFALEDLEEFALSPLAFEVRHLESDDPMRACHLGVLEEPRLCRRVEHTSGIRIEDDIARRKRLEMTQADCRFPSPVPIPPWIGSGIGTILLREVGLRIPPDLVKHS